MPTDQTPPASVTSVGVPPPAPGSVFGVRDLNAAMEKLAGLPRPLIGIVCRPDTVSRVRRMAALEAHPLFGPVAVYEKRDQEEHARMFYDHDELRRYLSPNAAVTNSRADKTL